MGRRNRRERNGHYGDNEKAKRQDLDVPNEIEEETVGKRVGNGVHVVFVGADNDDNVACLRLDEGREVQGMVLSKELEAEKLRVIVLSDALHAHTLYSVGDSVSC